MREHSSIRLFGRCEVPTVHVLGPQLEIKFHVLFFWHGTRSGRNMIRHNKPVEI